MGFAKFEGGFPEDGDGTGAWDLALAGRAALSSLRCIILEQGIKRNLGYMGRGSSAQ